MVPALIIAALAFILLSAAQSLAYAAADHITARNHGTSTPFVFTLASMPLGAAVASTKALGNSRGTPWIARVVLTSFNFGKFFSTTPEDSRWPQLLSDADEFSWPDG